MALKTFTGLVWKNLAKIEDSRLLARPRLKKDDYAVIYGGQTFRDDAKEQYSTWREPM